MKIFNKMRSAVKGLIVLAVIIFLSAAGFQDKNISGWYQQWFPNLNGSTIKDITFLDSLTGFAVTNANSLLQEYILKTTNGGDNWTINYNFSTPLSNYSFMKINFINPNTGFAFSWTEMFKTTNKGINWIKIDYALPWDDFAVINEDTIIGVSSSGLMGGVYRSTNGGYNWQLVWTNGSAGNPNRIYMYDKNLGFSCDDNSSYFRRTTNGGMNWTNITEDAFFGIKFFDSLIGWNGGINGGVKKTTNGGVNWVSQTTPQVYSFQCFHISVINKDTVWFEGSNILKNNILYGILFKTTNGGLNWGYQIPDTALHIFKFYYSDFYNKNNGWAYYINTGVHTKIGGNDTTYYTAINNNTTTAPEDYVLYQNYPNPFNPTTNIKYKILKSSNIRIDVTDILGRNIKTLVNMKQTPGNYEVKFNGENISSGIYFYSLYVNGIRNETKKMMLIK